MICGLSSVIQRLPHSNAGALTVANLPHASGPLSRGMMRRFGALQVIVRNRLQIILSIGPPLRFLEPRWRPLHLRNPPGVSTLTQKAVGG